MRNGTSRRAFAIGAAAALGGLGLAPWRAAAAREGAIEPRQAPDWDIAEWLNADADNVGDHRGKVIVVEFFQLWRPACNLFTGPLMQHWQERFSEEIADGKLLLLKIHTVFEGHDFQNVERLKNHIEDKGITMPVGVDRHVAGDTRPVTKKRYRTGGTPELAMIDQEGMIRFQKFGGFDHVAAEKYLEELLGVGPSPKRREPLDLCLATDLCG